MGFCIVDFSSVQYPDGSPAVRQGKFLHLLEDEGEELLVLSPYGLSVFHAQILERYCTLNGIEGRFLRKPELYEITEAGIKVVGGGHWRLDEAELRLELFGESKIYGRFGSEGLRKKIRTLPEYAKYIVVIE